MTHRNAGFTLLEMLAALVLLVIVITVMLAAFAQARRSLMQVHESDRLAQIARNLLDEQRGRRLQPGVRNADAGDNVRWTERVTELPTVKGQLAMYRLELTIFGPGRTSWQLSTLVVQSADVRGASQ
jgi:general secretion pathway protein I